MVISFIYECLILLFRVNIKTPPSILRFSWFLILLIFHPDFYRSSMSFFSVSYLIYLFCFVPSYHFDSYDSIFCLNDLNPDINWCTWKPIYYIGGL